MMYEFITKGLCEKVGMPQFGRQDQGVPPGGAMDLYSLQTGNVLLGNPVDEPALEMIVAPEIRFLSACYIVITGAGFDAMRLISGETEYPVVHGQVLKASAGAVLRFGNRSHGFRSYLCVRPLDGCQPTLEGRSRGDFTELMGWYEPDNVVRVLEGPEHQYLDYPEYFVDSPWKISNDISRMGMRLDCLREMPSVSMQNMISGPVADGTVQLTPNGPIILLRHRQTVGGYPRIFNVISSDIDKLGQFAPGQIIRFRKVTVQNAVRIAKAKATALQRLKSGDYSLGL